MTADDDEPLTAAWLISVGFDAGTLHYSKLLPPVVDGEIVELTIAPANPEIDLFLGVSKPDPHRWSWGVEQGIGDGKLRPWDDYVVFTSIYPETRGHVRRLLAALGCRLTEKS